MSRSGYSEDCETINLYRGTVARSIRGKRGQAFLLEMGKALDAMPVKELITGELVNHHGDVCAIGSVAVAKGIDVSSLDVSEADDVAAVFGIAPTLAREIVYENDEAARWEETPAQRWERMRKWVNDNLEAESAK